LELLSDISSRITLQYYQLDLHYATINLLTNDAKCTPEIKSRITMAEAAFSKMNTTLKGRRFQTIEEIQ
jgi:hypothetical protein